MTYDPRLRCRDGPGSTRGRSPSDRYHERRRRRAIAARPGASTNSLQPTLASVADAEFLLDVYEERRRYGGPAPGLDGLTYANLGRSEVAGILRVLAQTVRNGSYRPQPARPVKVPKSGGGQRTLALRSLCDRVVAAALNQVLTPVWENVFLDGSWGFRPGAVRGACWPS
jgi:retron-type reverse transcriptase